MSPPGMVSWTRVAEALGCRGRWLLAAVVWTVFGVGGAQAAIPPLDSPKLLQERQQADIAELVGLAVTEIRVIGTRRIEEKTVRFKIGTQIGEKLSTSHVRQDVRAIFETGFFENVLVFGERKGDGVVLTYQVIEKPALSNIEILGNHSLSTEKLLKVIDLSSREGLKPKAIGDAAEKIRQEYLKNGYYYVTVTPRVQAVSEEESKVIFEVDEGDKLRVETVQFVGNKSFGEGNRFFGLKSKLKKTREHWFWSFLTKSGKYSPESLEEDLSKLKEFYTNHGFLDIKIGEPHLEIEEDPKRAEMVARGKTPDDLKKLTKRLHLTVPIEEGPRYRVGKLTLEGNALFKEDVVFRALRAPAKQRELQKGIFSRRERVLKEGEWFSLDALRGGVSNIQDLYGNAGYIYANVFPEKKQDAEKGIVDIHFVITEDQVAYVHRIEFQGNTRTRDKVLRRELGLYEGDVFKSGLFKYSISRLQALGYVTELSPDVKPTEDRRELDINIKLNDTRQTELQLGGGFRNPDGFFGTLSVSEHNFLGYGQELNLSVAASKQIQNYDFSFSEPYLFDSNYSGAVSVFRLDQSPTTFRPYRERQTGGRLTLGKYLLRSLQARVSYGFQVTNLSDFNINETNQNLLEFAGTSSTSSLVFSLSRNSLNNRRDPTSGNSSFVSAELAGFMLGGDNNYFKLEAQSVQYFPLGSKLTYAVRGRVGYAGSFRGYDLPFFERFELGGERSLRGFQNYSVGPLNQNLDNLGGNKEILINQELSVPLADPLRVVLFLDAGNVFSDKQGYDLTGLRSSAGVEVRFFIPQFWVPIRFIWGWKLDKKENEDPSDFTFSIGTTF
jgi:outer membrane protein insertion porin family